MEPEHIMSWYPNSMELILAWNPALSTEWPGWVAKMVWTMMYSHRLHFTRRKMESGRHECHYVDKMNFGHFFQSLCSSLPSWHVVIVFQSNSPMLVCLLQVNNACATGSSALNMARQLIAGGKCNALQVLSEQQLLSIEALVLCTSWPQGHAMRLSAYALSCCDWCMHSKKKSSFLLLDQP